MTENIWLQFFALYGISMFIRFLCFNTIGYSFKRNPFGVVLLDYFPILAILSKDSIFSHTIKYNKYSSLATDIVLVGGFSFISLFGNYSFGVAVLYIICIEFIHQTIMVSDFSNHNILGLFSFVFALIFVAVRIGTSNLGITADMPILMKSLMPYIMLSLVLVELKLTRQICLNELLFFLACVMIFSAKFSMFIVALVLVETIVYSLVSYKLTHNKEINSVPSMFLGAMSIVCTGVFSLFL